MLILLQRYKEAAARTGQRDFGGTAIKSPYNRRNKKPLAEPAGTLKEVFDKEDGFGVVSEREDIFRQLHGIVAGV